MLDTGMKDYLGETTLKFLQAWLLNLLVYEFISMSSGLQ